jgi:restriction system protein
MAVPDFQSLMLPVLRASADGEIASTDIRKHLADQLKLSAEDLAERQASGTQTKFMNRTAWAIFYLERAGLLDRARRGVYRASDAGRTALEGNPANIDLKFLQKFPKYIEWRHKNPIPEDSGTAPSGASAEALSVTPEEQMDKSEQLLTTALAQQLLDTMREMDPTAFEALVVDLLVKLGYGGGRPENAKLTGKPGDGGIDGTISEDALGLDVVCVQAKCYKEGNNVGRPAVQQFAGSLDGAHASKGVLITTSDFSTDARNFVQTIGKRITLIDGQRLARLMIEKGVGVTVSKTYVVKKIDENYFTEN